MAIDVDDLIQLLGTLASEAGMQVTVKQSLKGGLITGAVAAAGGIIMGPPGLAVGGALGGTIATYATWGKFKSVGEVITSMDKQQKRILYDTAMTILKKASIDDLVTLNAMLAGDLIIRKQLLDSVVDHVKNRLDMELTE